jgi:hypothetical protein
MNKHLRILRALRSQGNVYNKVISSQMEIEIYHLAVVEIERCIR